ncbi:aminotransferase class III-fold pyridoxal phosphate-dependent enzyme [Candidatus Peregrinibacteria bacterium]|nr:aminotransferase class III-fold pyridoxal phosphate-dependent enzyme [Candidatus Peregrinibacteria bacterium]
MKLFEKAHHYLINTYVKYPIQLTQGKGSFVWDNNGKKYLDFYGGHAVCLLGHNPKETLNALCQQAKKLIFYSNIFNTAPAILLAEQVALTLKPKKYQVYFTNSGSEANETALKIARKHTGKKHIISFKNSFHGRGITALGVTGINSYHQCVPNIDDFTSFAELGDMNSVKSAWKPDTAAVICEPIQSIGGMNMAKPEFYKALAQFCKEKNILLIFDEVQTGLGRTGTFWFARNVGVFPHIITSAKGIACGLPLAAVIVKKRISAKIKIGDHATTFGGGPAVCAAGLATIKTILQPGFLANVKNKEAYIRKKLTAHPLIACVKGQGLLLGIEFTKPMPHFVELCLENGFILGTSYNKKVFRIMPPLTVSKNEIDLFVKLFFQVLTQGTSEKRGFVTKFANFVRKF